MSGSKSQSQRYNKNRKNSQRDYTNRSEEPQKSPFGMRVPPQNIDAERALLGSLMLRSTALMEIADMIDVDTFYAAKHQRIYQAMLDLSQKHEPIDLVTVSNRLREKGELESIGGASYLNELGGGVPSATNIKHYADVVLRKATLRQLIAAGDLLSELGFDEENDIDDTLDQAEKAVFAITSGTSRSQAFVGIKEILPAAWENMERLSNSTEALRGVPTGFVGIDNKLAGLQKSDLIILAARPSTGKTSLALDIARQAALHGQVPVAFFSLEMSSQQLVDRMLASEAQVDLWKMRTGKKLTEDDFTKVRDAMGRLASAPIYIDDQAGNTILRMRSTARRLKSEFDLGLIMIDYLQLIMPGRHYDSMVNQVSDISRALKALARELDVPVLALSQLSRAVESRGGKPRLSDLRDSGAIEQDADVVMFLHREKDEDGGGRSNHTEVLIEKHRNGATGKVELYFDADRASFMNIEQGDFSGGFGEETAGYGDDDFGPPPGSFAPAPPVDDGFGGL